MRYDPMRIVLFCDNSMILPNRHPLKSLADAGYEVFLLGGAMALIQSSLNFGEIRSISVLIRCGKILI